MMMDNITKEIRGIFEKKKLSSEPFNNNLDAWNLACVSMDALEDTLLALNYYEKHKGSNCDGARYLRLYGVLQSIFIQQDAIKFLCKILIGCFEEGKYKLSSWKEIRDLRNLTVGHPLNKNSNKRCYITRMSISKDAFRYIIWDKSKRKDIFCKADLKGLIDGYKKEAIIILQDILNILKSDYQY
ncbi:MAG: hypothetical protein Q8O30_07320 [Candidatus Omnitrophota bacterium]|nr:hypothetical protein [Candidatus Omnitrophota bacterium]